MVNVLLNRIWLIIGVVVVISTVWSLPAVAGGVDVIFGWDHNQPYPDGYRVFARKGGEPFNYGRPAWEGTANRCLLHLADASADYYFVVRAFTGSLESVDSEVIFRAGTAPTPAAAAPTITPHGSTFSSSVQVRLQSDTTGAAIYYTTNGSTPSSGSTRYTGPFTLTSSATVKARVVVSGHDPSPVVSATFTRSSASPANPVPNPPAAGGIQQSHGGGLAYGGTPWAVPGTILAVDYDLGGEGVGYHDKTAVNIGGQYRPAENVDIWYSAEEGYYTGANAGGEWRNYTIHVQAGGTYSLDLLVATPLSGRRMRVALNGADLTGPILIPNTGAWNVWRPVMTTVQLPAGTHVLRVIFEVGGLNFSMIDIHPIGAGTIQQQSHGGGLAYGGTPWAVPGTIPAVDYDLGGEGVGYHDKTAVNIGGQYRPAENVDIWYSPEEGHYYTGGNAGGEWRNYTIHVQAGGTYSLDLLVATPLSGRRMRVALNGADLTGPIQIPNTGAWNVWRPVMTTVQLPAGTHVLRVIFEVGGLNFSKIDIHPIGAGAG